MPSVGPNNPATGANVTIGGGTDWAGPGNVTSSDGTDATITIFLASQPSNGLQATNFSFSAVPVGATIDGMIGEIERRNNGGAGGNIDNNVQVVIGGTRTGNNKALVGLWPGTDTYATYGNSSDLWGTTPTRTQVVASDFGFLLQCYRGSDAGGGLARVDHMRMTVYYTEASSASMPRVVHHRKQQRAQ